MLKTATDNDLLTYEKYYKLKDKFNNKYTENDRIKPNELLDHADFNTSSRSKFRPFLDKLLNHIRNHGVFLDNEPDACRYISYILSKDVQTKGFYIEKIKPPTLSENAKPKVLGQPEQQKNHGHYEVSKSKSISSLADPQIPHANPDMSHVVSQTTHTHPQEPHAKPGISHVVFQTFRAHPETAHEESQSSQETLAHNAQHAVQQKEQVHQHGSIPITELQVDVSQVYAPHYRSLETSGTSSNSEQYTYSSISPLANDMGGASSSVISTITSALKDVDPVPVVGVSGGMGALFLLFRYTPVGAFFRGGRGRAHRIPRSFNGPFLGEFQGYQDYYGGNIGYGPMNPLAE
ncbi:hypothetical protein PVT01_000061400 [Plasmodium vivax]|uniref:VIR protein n=1 Tax=Plasmodium vivax TaxID=5855 RepID=A0A1G4E4A4_PLAVI|nr:hypothetical protein PVT01_000061400 [Plasmodium vivax]